MLLWDIDQIRTDGGREDNISMALYLEYPAGSLGRVESTIKIDPHDLAPLIGGVVLGGDIRDNPRVDDHDIKFPEILHDLLHNRLDLRLDGHIGFVRCRAYVVSRCNLGCNCIGGMGCMIDQSDLCKLLV